MLSKKMAIKPFQKMRAAIVGLLGYLLCGPLPLSALNPGDVALTRITPNSVLLLALVDIPAGERIIFTDIRWTARGFDTANADSNDGYYVWFAPAADGVNSVSGGLAAGEQVEIVFPDDSVFLQWQEYLFLFQGSVNNPTFLYAVFADVNWNLWDNPARGLTNDITSITIGTIFGAPTDENGDAIINHEIISERRDNFSGKLDQLGWLSKFTSISSWTWVENNTDAIDNQNFEIVASQGLIEFTSDRHLIKDDRGAFSVILRRLYGSEGDVSVRVSTATRISDYSALKPRTSGTFDDLTGIAHGNGTFVIVSSGEGTLTSPDGFAWTLHTTPFENLHGIAFGLNRFVAVGGDGLILASADGVTWASQTSPTGVTLFGIEFINDAFYAVGEENTILTSPDVETWTRVNGGNTSGALYGIAFGSQIEDIADNNLFAAVGKEGAIFTSTDGENWSPSATDFTEKTLWEVIYSSAGFTAVADGGRVLVSTDGLNWEEKRSGARLSLFAITAAGSALVAVGSEGLIISTEDDSVFKPTRRRVRATSLYDIIFASGTAVVVGEYGRILSVSVTGGTELSASSAIDFTAVSNASVFWADGDTEPKTQTISFSRDLSTNLARKRFDLRIFQGLNDPDLGVSTTEISLFSTNPLRSRIIDNYGAFLTFKNVDLSRNNADATQPHQLSFQIQNTSSTASRSLRIQFDGSNLPDLDLGFTVPAESVSEVVQIDLQEIVQSISLFELLTDDDEPVFKHKRFINSVFIVDERVGNGVKSGTLGRGFVTDLTPLPGESVGITSSSKDTSKEKGGGIIKPFFSGGTPPPPPGEGGGEGFGLVLTKIELTGNVSIETDGSADFTAMGTFLDPFTFEEFVEELTDPQPDWDMNLQSFPVDANGLITANPNPALIYPQASALSASAIDGAPVDEQGNPIPVVGNLNVSIDEPVGNQDYSAWVIAFGLTGGASSEKEDFEGDGLANLLEFSLGTDPTVENPEGLPFRIVDKGGGSYIIQYTRPKSLKGVIYKLQKSTAFHPWNDLGQTLFSEDEFTETWEATATENSPSNFRLVIERFDQ